MFIFVRYRESSARPEEGTEAANGRCGGLRELRQRLYDRLLEGRPRKKARFPHNQTNPPANAHGIVSKSPLATTSSHFGYVCRKPNIFDNMLSIMEKYATNLESQVAERTHLLMEEKKKTDALLYSMLPR